MKNSQDRILTTHTGSLPRPPDLVELLVRRFNDEPVDEAEFDRRVEKALRAAIANQVRSGIDVGSNGEQGREGFFRYVKHRMDGFGGSWRRTVKTDLDRYPEFRRLQERERSASKGVQRGLLPTAIGDIVYRDDSAIRAECASFHAALKEAGSPFVETFMNAPSPGIISTAMQNRHYDSQAAYIAALGKALRVEYEAIVEAGFLLQIDAPDLALEADVAFQDRPVSDFLDFVACVVDTINNALANIPRDRVRMHVCWGNGESPHDCDIPLADVLPIIRRANVGALVLPFANPRHAHEYRLLKTMKLADDQIIVAGVIDSTTNFIEHPEVVADRLQRVADAMGDSRRVMAGTDCGMETTAGSSRLAPDVAWAKLKAMSDGAKLASQRLFPKGNPRGHLKLLQSDSPYVGDL